MEKVNLENIIKSFFLGIFIGVVLQFNDNGDGTITIRFIILLASGSMGFIIGFITELLTSILPITMAKSWTYFIVSNLIALIVTAIIMLFSIILTNDSIKDKRELIPIVFIVLSIVFVANIIDYIMYIRAQKKLKTFKQMLENK